MRERRESRGKKKKEGRGERKRDERAERRGKDGAKGEVCVCVREGGLGNLGFVLFGWWWGQWC